MDFHTVVENMGLAIEGAGVFVIVAGSAFSAYVFLRALIRSSGEAYRSFRHSLGRSILLGLELLVAGDIIRTVAVDPTLRSVGVLAGIVLIRTFLSFTIELELTGRLPWRQSGDEQTQQQTT